MEHSSHDTRGAPGLAAVMVAILAGALAIFLRCYFVSHAEVMQPLYLKSGWGDSGEYYRYAWNLVHHALFSSDIPGITSPKPDSFRDPAYPVFLAIAMMATDNYGQWYEVVLLTQAVIGGITVTIAALALRQAMPTWLLAVAATLMAVWPHLVAIPAYVLSENLTAFFCALTVLALNEASRRQSMLLTVAGGIALTGAALSNAVLAPLFVPLVLALAWKRSLTRRQLVVFAAVVVVPLFAWGIRNSTIPGPFSSSFRAEVNLVQGSWPTYHVASQLYARNDPVGIETIDMINREINTLRLNRTRGLEVLAARMGHAPGTYIWWYFTKPALLWGWEIGLGNGDIYVYPTRNSPFIVNPVMRAVEAVTYIFNGVLALLALAGLVIVACRRSPSTAMLTFAVTAAWVTAVYGVLQSDARYSIPYRTAEIALACVTIVALADYIHRRIAAARGPAQ
jgi:4-amino-4-deoxy-L-arabinose transferase-like glycosyltransferase